MMLMVEASPEAGYTMAMGEIDVIFEFRGLEISPTFSYPRPSAVVISVCCCRSEGDGLMTKGRKFDVGLHISGHETIHTQKTSETHVSAQ